MNPPRIIQAAATAGIHLAARDGQIELTAKDRPDAQMLGLIRNNKTVVVTELERLQRLWLERVAYLLQSTPEHLLSIGAVDQEDMLEQWHTEPRHAADLVRRVYPIDQYQAQPINRAKEAK